MDKNTVTGLLLIAAIMFGFFYCTKPDASRRHNSAADRTESVAAETAVHEVRIDSIQLRHAVEVRGERSEAGAYTYSDSKFDLTLGADGNVSGTVVAGSDTAAVADILSGMPGTYEPARALADFVKNSLRYGTLAGQIGGEGQATVLENDLVKVTLTTLGAMVEQVELKKYKSELGETPQPIQLFHPGTDGYGFSFHTADQRVDTRDFNFQVTAATDSSVTYTLNPSAQARWNVTYTLRPGSYIVDMAITQTGMDTYLPVNTSSMEFAWFQKMGRNEKGKTFEKRQSAIYYKYVGEGPDDLKSEQNDREELNGLVRWVAFKNQFFSSVIIAREPFTSANLNSTVLKDSPDYLKDMLMTATVPYSVSNGDVATYSFYFGPNDYSILRKLDDTIGAGEDLDLTRLIPLGWGLFRWINTLIVIPVFNFLSPIGNYGIIILLLTIFIKIILFPFTFKSFQSQAKMRVLAPEVKKINEKYPNKEDAAKRSTETMALYSRAGASPFSGCLPMLLQMPVLIAMFSFFPSAIELRGQSFLWAHDLSAPDSILTLPFSIPFYGNHVSLFCLLMTVVNIVYMHISMSSQPGGNSMPGMKVMQYLMPVMFLFIFNDYASGLSYYYFLSLLITIIQSWAFRHFTDEDKLRLQMEENAKKPRKKSGFLARLEEAQRQAEAAQRQQRQRRR